MKIKLLNDGGYGDMENVKFPVVIDAVKYDLGVNVSGFKLMSLGAKDFDENETYYFSEILGDYEVIEK